MLDRLEVPARCRQRERSNWVTDRPKDTIDIEAWLKSMLDGTAGVSASNVPRPPRLWAIRANKLHHKKMEMEKQKLKEGVTDEKPA